VRICFFAHVDSPEVLERIEFYRQDIEILRSLGHEVIIARRLHEIPWDVDLYFVWWWTWAFQPLTIARLCRKPIFVTGVLDHPFPLPERGFARRPVWERLPMLSSLRFADRNVFVSRWEFEGVPRDYRVGEPRFIPLAVDAEFYRPSGVSREPLILSVIWMESYNVWRKCAVEIVEAIPAVAARQADVRFVIAGEHGDGFEKVQAAARQLGVEAFVSFPGAVSREEKLRLMQRCQIYLQPTRFEGFGVAILEAMSCGAPVISNPAGAVPEVVGNAGLMLDSFSPDTVAEGVLSLLGDAPRREELSARGRQRAETLFSFPTKREALRQLLSELAVRNPS
jgi:glycosyltransferase involved in cell wall biosynthesis